MDPAAKITPSRLLSGEKSHVCDEVPENVVADCAKDRVSSRPMTERLRVRCRGVCVRKDGQGQMGGGSRPPPIRILVAVPSRRGPICSPAAAGARVRVLGHFWGNAAS